MESEQDDLDALSDEIGERHVMALCNRMETSAITIAEADADAIAVFLELETTKVHESSLTRRHTVRNGYDVCARLRERQEGSE
jgi:hypothetical protein